MCLIKNFQTRKQYKKTQFPRQKFLLHHDLKFSNIKIVIKKTINWKTFAINMGPIN